MPFGPVAQLGEHRFCKAGVVGSIPTGSTTFIMSFARSSRRSMLGDGARDTVGALPQGRLSRAPTFSFLSCTQTAHDSGDRARCKHITRSAWAAAEAI